MPTFLSTPRKSRRILQVITPSRMSGAEMQLVRMTPHMEARGHAISTVIKRGSPAVIDMHRLGLHAEPHRISGKLNPAAISRIARAARQYRADVVQSSLSTASWWSGWLERCGGPPSIGHVHGFTSAKWHRYQSHLLAVSNAVKLDLVAQGIQGDRITVLHNALAPNEFFATRDPRLVRAELGADADTPIVGTFAHLSPKKGHSELFDAIPTVVKKLPNAQFWIVGDGGMYDELHTKAKQAGFLSNIRFLGYRRDVANLMNAIDLMVLPSHREPCALVYVEAALSRKPSVGCRSGGAPESIEEGETGLLCTVGDSDAMASAILQLLTNRDYASKMGHAAYDRAIDIFGWQHFIATLERVYERVLDESAAFRRAA
jgi:glycosyltransferase involved in cell wall biosynthesis